jgi:hypothetical protein
MTADPNVFIEVFIPSFMAAFCFVIWQVMSYAKAELKHEEIMGEYEQPTRGPKD